MPFSHFLLMLLLIFGHSSKMIISRVTLTSRSPTRHMPDLNWCRWFEWLLSSAHFDFMLSFRFYLDYFLFAFTEISMKWCKFSSFGFVSIVYRVHFGGSFTGRFSIKTYFQLFEHDIEYVWIWSQREKNKVLPFPFVPLLNRMYWHVFR